MNTNIPNALTLGKRISNAARAAERANIFAGEALRKAREYERNGKHDEAAEEYVNFQDANSRAIAEEQNEKMLINKLAELINEQAPVKEAA